MNVELDKSFFIRTFVTFVFALVIQSKVILSIPLPKVGATILTDAKHEHPTRGGNYLLMKEIWKDITGYEGFYQVSNYGKIKSLDRISHQGNFLKGTVGYTYKATNGYIKVTLTKCGKSKHFLAHRIVAESFLDKTDGKTHVNHIDGNKTNNYFLNLEWCTPLENIRHSIDTGLTNKKGENCWNSILKESDVIEIRSKIGALTTREISVLFAISIPTVYDIKHRRTWTHI